MAAPSSKAVSSSKNARTLVATQKFLCSCGGEVTMKTLLEKGRRRNIAECNKCQRQERRPRDFRE